MNIVTPTPTAVLVPTVNVNTEAARRDNQLRETIPQTTNLEKGEPERGLGSESDRAKQATGQFSSPLVYERPSIQSSLANPASQNLSDDRDNARDESAGKEEAEQKQQEQAEQREVRELKARDAEVKAHEQAHASVGGQYAGSPQFEFESGPDGQRYAVGGEVSIDISEESTPEETLKKMQQVRAAALAPAEPSPQDLRVASEANKKAFEARSQINNDAVEEINVASNEISPPTRTLDQATLDEQEEHEVNDPESRVSRRALAIDEEVLSRRNQVIASFYAGAVTPAAQSLSVSA